VPAKLDARTGRAAAAIGQQLRQSRIAAGVSQEALAAKIGMTRGNYARIEAGLSNVTLESLLRIAAGLGVEVAVTFEAKRPPNRAPRGG
jgi:HTH-type transcriptional regulator/antitoxin HipB